MNSKVLFVFALCIVISFGQELGENAEDTAATEATEQHNEAGDAAASSTEANGSVAEPSGDEIVSGDKNGDAATEANDPNKPSENSDLSEPSANTDNTATSTDETDTASNAEPENTAPENGNSNETEAGASDESGNADAAITVPEDANASPSNENAESNDDNNTAASSENTESADSSSLSASSNAETTTASADNGAVTEQPSTEAPEFRCDSVGRFECPHSCEQYYFCWDTTGDHAVFSCPHHKAFDPITQLCVHNFAVCAAAPKCEVDRQVSPDPDDKSSFFECKLNERDDDDDDDDSTETFEVRKKDCAHGHEFDADLGYCTLTIPEDGSEDDSSAAEKQDCTQAGIFIDFSNESRFYECVVKNVAKGKLKLIHHKCPKYHVFSMADKQCIPLLPTTA